MFIGIKDGKIVDVCSNILNAIYSETRWGTERYISLNLAEEEAKITYIEIPENEALKCIIGDTWDDINKTSLQDAPIRTAPTPKTTLELKIEELEVRILELESAKEV